MWLAVGFVFQPKWTDEIHNEWMENVLEHRPELSRPALERTRNLMNQWGGDWSCIGYTTILPTLTLPDPDETHVLAAAIASNAPYLVTFNLADFPKAPLAPYNIEAIHQTRLLYSSWRIPQICCVMQYVAIMPRLKHHPRPSNSI